MPTLSHRNQYAFTRLKSAYDALPWYSRLFFPSAMARQLEAMNGPRLSLNEAFNLYNSFVNETWFFQRWLFSALRVFSNTDMIMTLRILRSTGLLTGEGAEANFNAVANHQTPMAVFEALRELHTAHLLTGEGAQANFNAVANHQNPQYFAWVLRELCTTGLLTGEGAEANFNAVANHQTPMAVFEALRELHTTGLLTGEGAQANRDAVASHQNALDVVFALSELRIAGLLTGEGAQANFDAVIVTYAPIFFGRNEPNAAVMWDRIPPGQLTSERFQAILAIAAQHIDTDVAAGRAAFIAYVNRHILGMDAPHAAAPQRFFNTHQSTHTASVHASVSASATQLWDHYYEQRLARGALDRKIKELSDWVNALSGHAVQPEISSKTHAAQRCIARLTAADYAYTDRVSGVSTRQLLALAWIGIHDENARLGTLEDAKSQLLEGLYEIQRGYNLSEIGIDDGAQDRPICSVGTFNKLLEKLSGLHSDVSIVFITKEGASAKLPIVAREEAGRYLQVMGDNPPDDIEDVVTALMGENDDMSGLWAKISTRVNERLFEEFGRLYPHGQASAAFQSFIVNGIYAIGTEEMKDALLALNPASSRPGLG